MWLNHGMWFVHSMNVFVNNVNITNLQIRSRAVILLKVDKQEMMSLHGASLRLHPFDCQVGLGSFLPSYPWNHFSTWCIIGPPSSQTRNGCPYTIQVWKCKSHTDHWGQRQFEAGLSSDQKDSVCTFAERTWTSLLVCYQNARQAVWIWLMICRWHFT